MKYDPFQKKAISYINEGHSVLVAAPTGAGKTAIAEHVIEDCLKKNSKVIYTAPIKALSNQKYRDFQKKYKDKIGILTGDVTLNPKAQVLIMTTEIFRNKILEETGSLDDFSWIIFDEIHYLDDYDRGTVWEESLIFLPEHMNVLGLSATIPNIDQLKEWLESIHHKNFKVVKEDKRPVPLHFYFQCQGRIYSDLEETVKKGFISAQYPRIKHRRFPRFVRIKPSTIKSIIDHLKKRDLFPCIYFVFSRKKAEYLAEELQEYDFLTCEERNTIVSQYDHLCERYDLMDDDVRVSQLRAFIKRGIAYHHAGMLPTLKEVVEQLFTSRLLKVIFTTETFALGINMPARAVVFDELRKFYGRAFATLRTRDLYQMAGRAGRRSIDDEGFVFCRVNPHNISPGELHKAVYGKSEEVRSQFNASYATILNLYQNYGDKLYDIYPQSFHYFRAGKSMQKKALYFLKGKVDILKELGYLKNGQLTKRGEFARHVYGYELMLTEIFNQGIFEKLSVQDLGVLSMAVVFEPRKGQSKPEVKRKTKNLENQTHKINQRIRRLENLVGFTDMCKQCYFHLTPVVEAWIDEKSFADVMRLTDVDEGEVVRYFRMTIQVLRDMSKGEISPQFHSKIYQLIDLINRDVVDCEKQLRS